MNISPLHHLFSSRSFCLILNSQPCICSVQWHYSALPEGELTSCMSQSIFSYPFFPIPRCIPLWPVSSSLFSLHSHSLPPSPFKRAKCFTSVNSWVWEELIIVEKERNLGLGATFVDWGSCAAKRAIRFTEKGRLTCVSVRYYSLIGWVRVSMWF